MESQRERLVTHLRKFVGKAKIDDHTRVYHDLKIAGDDAIELIGDLRTDFQVDFDGMKFSDYFPGETDAFPEHLGRLLRLKSKRKPLTVGHLLLVVEKGRWQEPSTDAPQSERVDL